MTWACACRNYQPMVCCWSHQTEGPIILLIGSFALEICLNQAFFDLECGAVKLAFIPLTAQLTN